MSEIGGDTGSALTSDNVPLKSNEHGFNIAGNDAITDNKYRKGTIFGATMNLINANIGIGTIGLGYGVLQSGWVLAIIFFAIFHTINHFTIYFMLEIGSYFDTCSYAIVCSKYNIIKIQMLNEWSLLCELLLSCTSYLIIIGDFMSILFEQIFPNNNSNQFYYNRQFWIIIYAIVFIIPATLPRTLESLKYLSFTVLICFVYLAIIIVYYYFNDDTINNDNVIFNKYPDISNPLVIFRTMALFTMAYGGHVIVFAQTSEIKNPSLNRLSIITIIFSCACTAVFVTVAFFGFFTFGDMVDPNIILNYNSNTAINIVRIALCIGLSFSYAILTNTIKNSLATIIYGVGIKNDKYALYRLFTKNSMDYVNIDAIKERQNQNIITIERHKYIIIVSIIIIFTVSLSLITDNLGFLFQLNGATASAFNQIIFPGLIYIYAYKNNDKNNPIKSNPYSNIKYYFSVSIVIFGIFLVPFMLYFAFESLY